MTPEQEVLQSIEAAIIELPVGDQLQIHRIANKIRIAVELNPDYGKCALVLVGAEYAAK